jgi:hypothetical protein
LHRVEEHLYEGEILGKAYKNTAKN